MPERTPTRFVTRLVAVSAILMIAYPAMKASGEVIRVSVTPSQVTVGDTVQITVESLDERPLDAEILIPDKDAIPLSLTKVKSSHYDSRFIIGKNAPQGLYAVQ